MNINYTYSYTNNFVIINKIIISMNYLFEFLNTKIKYMNIFFIFILK